MNRVSTDMLNNDMQYWLRRREAAMADLETKMARQTRLPDLRSDPMAAAHAVKYDSFISRLKRFEENAAFSQDMGRVAEGYVRQAQEIMQRIREIAVQGANGIYSKEDSSYMAKETNELLNELVSISNARGPDGRFLFAGDKITTEPFRGIKGFVPGSGEEQVTGVQYLGSIGERLGEITQDAYVAVNQPGNAVFWAENQALFARADAAGYRVLDTSSFQVDGYTITVRPGDTVSAVIAKINDSGAPVKASLDPERNSLVLETTYPHQLWLEEGKGGRVLSDLGLLGGPGLPPPDNLAPSVTRSGGSLFDAVIALRDSLYAGDVIETGGRALGSIDAALANLNLRVSELGARDERLEQARLRLNKEIPDVTKLLSQEADLDVTEAIMNFKMMEQAQQAALGMAGRVLPQTLLDFLR